MDKDSREFIVWLFRGRCLICYRSGTDVNEILPRARGQDSLAWQNKVLMCHEHHMAYHDNGVSPQAVLKMQERRSEFLIAIGREEYV